MKVNEADALPADACIAIVGMACRFPDANTPDEFWHNLANGRSSVRDYDEASLRAAGVLESELTDPAYVRSGIPLQDFDTFDAAFFGVSPKDARVMDPQHRKFLECAWSALEDAGHTPACVGRNIGVFAGCGMHWYLIRNVLANPGLVREMGEFLIRHTANDKDFMATRVSFHLDLHGPSMNVQTACSTSLVAVHLACQSLLNGECEMALAGGSTIEVPHNVGYLHREGEIRSADGRCRPLDAAASGTMFGSGCGVVVLRRLSDALAAGDTVLAVIRGSAMGNDGGRKANYLAPSVEGQARVIAEAMAVAGVDPATIGYVETPGTGTPLGDPIEVAALTEAFGATSRRQYCVLGSAKSNIGHLDTASGVAGLIKVVLAMRHRKLPALLQFRTPSPEVDWAGSPFHVNATLADWPRLGAPLRAGVSSVGVGGTNAHVVVEEAPDPPPASAAARTWILPLSARSADALVDIAGRLRTHLQGNPDLHPDDVAWTLREGRMPFEHRVAVIGRSVAELIQRLRDPPVPRRTGKVPPRIVFMFPDQGVPTATALRRLHAGDRAFRTAIDECAQVLRRQGRQDVAQALDPAVPDAIVEHAARVPAIAQPLLFCFEYAIAISLREKGVRADAMIGCSLGEYVAACLADVFTLEGALGLVCRRGELLGAPSCAAMLAVPAGGPESYVLSGDSAAIEDLQVGLAAEGVDAHRLPTSHALHAQGLESILLPLAAAVDEARPAARDGTGVVSAVTGTWLTAAQSGSTAYWVEQLHQPDRFLPALHWLAEAGPAVYLEMGPGQTLSRVVRNALPTAQALPVLGSGSGTDDGDLAAVGAALWTCGVDLDWSAWGQPVSGRRIPLPTYPFRRQRHWLDPPGAARQHEAGLAQASASGLAAQGATAAQHLPRPDVGTAYVAPHSPLQHALVTIWQEALGIEGIGLDDNFFELGGNSLLLMRLVSRLGRDQGVVIPVEQAFATPTIANLDALASSAAPASAAVERVGRVDRSRHRATDAGGAP